MFSHVNTSLTFFTLKNIFKNNQNAFGQGRSEQDTKYHNPMSLAGDAVYLMVIRTAEVEITMQTKNRFSGVRKSKSMNRRLWSERNVKSFQW